MGACPLPFFSLSWWELSDLATLCCLAADLKATQASDHGLELPELQEDSSLREFLMCLLYSWEVD